LKIIKRPKTFNPDKVHKFGCILSNAAVIYFMGCSYCVYI